DNVIHNYFVKGVWQAARNHKIEFSYTYDNKVRGHRRNTPPDFVPDIASLHQNNPASIYQTRYTGIFNKAVYESTFSVMSGQTSYLYQPGTNGALRVQDIALDTANYAAQYHQENPNSKLVFNNVVSYSTTKGLGEHLFKVGVQFTRLRYETSYQVNGDMYLIYNDGVPFQVQEWNTPANSLSLDHSLGFFAQDSWTIANKLTLNYGMRFDTNVGENPSQSSPAGTFVGARTLAASTPVDQKLAVWRLGMVYDPVGDGKTAIKGSYSRYGTQIGIDRAQNVNPFVFASQTCAWNDINHDGMAQANEISRCSGFPTKSVSYASPNGPKWPYSDEITAGIEREIPGDVRLGVMYYHRTNRDQIGTVNAAVPSSAYTPVTISLPGSPTGPGGTATFYNLNSGYLGLQQTVLGNQPYLNTNYNGVDITLNKRMSKRWQMIAGLTLGKNSGGVNSTSSGGQLTSADLNDPNNTKYPNGVVGDDSLYSFRVAGSYILPGEWTVAGSMISNQGYPYVSTYTITRSVYPQLTRSSQTVLLTSRGTQRLPNVTMVDLRFSRAFHFGTRSITPQLDLFNITNAATITGYNASVGSRYLSPAQILAPRIMRIGFSIEF
ncbi:MAG TPA: TonB-dependent receptor, partial [Vicinamibacterales bacterium]|nr:TonB-dependent receptor [Vicinamibacterales bacterium]